jgi:hypothetical protein
MRGTGSASVDSRFTVDSVRLQLAGCEPASCRINGAVNTKGDTVTTGYTGRARATLRREVKSKKFKLVLEKSPETTRV